MQLTIATRITPPMIQNFDFETCELWQDYMLAKATALGGITYEESVITALVWDRGIELMKQDREQRLADQLYYTDDAVEDFDEMVLQSMLDKAEQEAEAYYDRHADYKETYY